MADDVTPGQGQGWPPPPPGGGWDAPPPPPPPGGGWAPPPPPQGTGWPPPPPSQGGGWAAPPAPAPGGWGPAPAGYPPPYPGGYGPPPGGRPTETLGVWSLVLGIASFVVCPVVAAIAAIITGSRGKKAIRNSGGVKSGRGLATAGQVLGWANIVVSIGAAALIAVGVSFFSHHKSYTSLQVGDCFDKGSGSTGLSSLVTTVSCGKPHQQEAVGVFDFQPAGSQAWPGPAGFLAEATDKCGSMALTYLGHTDSSLRLVYVYPNRQAWDRGIRRVVCAVRNRDGTERTGSVHDTLGPSTNG
jgi:Domain of unknown function (DUF4190)/Septum formation